MSPAQEPSSSTIGLPGGFTVPLPSWTGTFFGIIAVAAIGFGVYRYFFPPTPELISVKQANEALQLEVTHYNQHIVDVPATQFEDDLNHATSHLGHIAIRVFNDGCLLISRKTDDATMTRLLVDPKLTTKTAWTVPAVEAALAAQGRCLNPHPGAFQSGYGARNGCFVQVWRTFQDGCQHWQWFDTCHSTFESNPDGSPKVTWVRCVH